MRGHSRDHDVHAAQRRFQIGGDLEPVGKFDAGKIDGIRPPRRYFRRQRRVPCPETGIVTAAGQMNSQRSAPSTRTKDCNLTNKTSYARCPIRRSVPAMTRARFARWR